MPALLPQTKSDGVITARLHPSGFEMADSNFNSLSLASDGRLYYTLCSHNKDTHGRVYRYDPPEDELSLVCDLGEIAGEAGRKTLPQGKSHNGFYEVDGKLFFSTHLGYFKSEEGKEMLSEVPEGYEPFPGGHLFSYDMATGEFEDLARAPQDEGLLTFSMDTDRRRMYAITWPSGLFFRYDLQSGEFRNFGPVSRGGEGGSGDQYFNLCRMFGMEPRTGDVYFTNTDGEVKRYDCDTERIETVEGVHMKRDALGEWDPHRPGHQGYNWRSILWHPEHEVFYGTHGKSGYLFYFDPAVPRIELIERICADSLRRSGRYEPFYYGYMTLALAPDRETLYYLTGAYADAEKSGHKGGAGESMHCVTYNLRTGRYRDHGAVVLEDGRRVEFGLCVVVHPTNGKIYTAPWIEKPDRAPDDRVESQCDLISFDDPLRSGR